MSTRSLALFASVVLLVACKNDLLPGRCDKASDCPSGQTCNLDRSANGNGRCIPTGSSDGGLDGDASEDSKNDGATPCGSGSCSVTTPVCDAASKKCRACASSAECSSLNAATPVCDPSGKCVECSASKECKGTTKPICEVATSACKACSSNDECSGKSSATPACASTGACVECTADTQCGLAQKPVCDMGTNTCRGCGTATECVAVSAATPACAPSGKCVECVNNVDCKASAKPICDQGTNTCRGCQSDSECTTGPQVCMKHQDGRCATDAETIYVQKTSACPGAAATADGTAAMPYCSMDPAVAAVGGTRDLIVVRGIVNGASSAFSIGSRQVSIVGQLSANVAGATDPAIHLTAGDLYVRSLKLSTGGSIGCKAEVGSVLRLDRVVVTGNSSGGILLDGAAFDVENTTVTNNGPSADATWGGIRIQNTPAGGPARLHLLTVQNNNPSGISCSASVTGTGVLASGNTSVDVSATCGFSSCGTTGSTCGAQP